MAITVDYSSYPYLITFAQSDCTLVEGTQYTITADKMWELMRDYADDTEGASHPKMYNRIAATSGTPSITEICSPTYEAEFENGSWSVDIINGNTNFRDVERKNTVSVGTNNNTGFVDLSDSATVTEIRTRLDLVASNPNTYADDGSSITNNDFTLTKSDNGDGTFDVNRT